MRGARRSRPRDQRISVESEGDKVRFLIIGEFCIISLGLIKTALPVLAGVLPADLEVIAAGQVDVAREDKTRAEVRVLGRQSREAVVAEWQKRWDEATNGRELYRYFPDVSARLSSPWVEPDYETFQLLTGHGCFRKRLQEMELNETSLCLCELTDEDMHHVLWSCSLYDDIRNEMLANLESTTVGPAYHMDLVGSRPNFRRFRVYARAWHRLRGGLT